ncbi:hypothetical protein HPB49_007360 [Dermacentor silvarum]|uniref:Uncharacterized protein n=1 Tax=Dermacentor silvarum TaxID=543639 RepID=A0ACB8D3U2_DERSI|nr:hypothetical protein HPB49_007360 [Dermacentor silvarum]
MKVGFAFSLFNSDTAAALRMLVEVKDNNISSEDATTAWFVDSVFKWFKLMSSRTTKLAISHFNENRYEDTIMFLKDMIDLFEKLEIGGDTKKSWKPIQTACAKQKKKKEPSDRSRFESTRVSSEVTAVTKGRTFENNHSKSTDWEPGVQAKPPESHHGKVSESGHERIAMDSASATKNKRPAKKPKRHRKADAPASKTTLEPVTGAAVRAAAVSIASTAQPIEEIDKQASCSSGLGAPTAPPGLDAPAIALSPTTAAPNEATQGPKACAYSSGLPIREGAERQSASSAFADREPGAVNAAGATSADATGGQVKDAGRSPRPVQLSAAGPENPDPTSPGATSAFATTRTANTKWTSAVSLLAEGTTPSAPHTMPPGGSVHEQYPFSSSPEGVGSAKAEINALLWLNSPGSLMSTDLLSGTPSAQVATQSSAPAPRRPVTQRKEQLARVSAGTQSRVKSVEESEALDKLRELCGADETLEHLLCFCPVLNKHRATMVTELRRMGLPSASCTDLLFPAHSSSRVFKVVLCYLDDSMLAGRLLPPNRITDPSKLQSTVDVACSDPLQKEETFGYTFSGIAKRRQTLVQRDQTVAVPVPTKTRLYCTVVAFISVLFLALAAAALISFVVRRSRTDATPTGDRFCRSSGCLDHADTVGLSDITDGLHKSSPCEEFGRFICSVWEARHERNNVRRRITHSVLTDAVTDNIFSIDDLIGQQHALSITKRPERMYKACLANRPSDDSIVLEQLLGFMQSSGFGFPAENVSESDYSLPLKALTELAYNWALPLWFYVDLVLPESVGSRTLTLSPAAFGDIYATIYEAITEYEDVHVWFVETLVATVYRGSIGASFHEFTRGSKILQKAVFRNLSQLTRSMYHVPALLQIERLPHFVVNTTIPDWLEALEPLWNIDPPISQGDVVYFPDRNLLVSMNALFRTYTARDIYLHVHWWFVQILGVLASNAVFDGLRRDPERGEFAQKALCTVQVAVNYNAIFSSEKRAHLHPSERADIMRRLGNVHAITVSKVSSAMGPRLAWLLEHMKPVFWLPGSYVSEERLLRLYGTEEDNATTDEDTFVDRWLSRAASYQQSSTYLEERSADASVFRTDSSIVTSHHVVSQVISLSIALLKVPFYYPNASSAIFYGGLGFIYATELVRVLNSLSVLLDGGETIKPSLSSDFSRAYVWAPYSCSGMNITDIFPQYMALELAYATYHQFRSDAEDVSLWNAQGYSPEQVFFATICYTMCDLRDGPHACTQHMMHFPEFATAFSCPPGFARGSCDILD